jgi:signal transduction histidine kinase
MGEAEREWLVARLITAEQDERRRLSVALHDGPLQSLSGVALMQDAALAAIREGRTAEATTLLEGAVERERAIIQELRDLSFAIEPVVLRGADLEVAVRQLADQLERARGIAVDVDVAAAAALGERSQVALYQVVREALSQAADRRPTHVSIVVRETAERGYEASVADDGVTERRRASVEALEERARLLGAVVDVATDEGGTAVSVSIPRYVAEG